MTNKNELQSFEEEFFKRIREHDAWKKISAEWDFPDKIIERYADKWDWKELSENQAIWWSEELLEKFKNRIDWNLLSSVAMRRSNYRSNSLAFDWNIVKKFDSYWNWQLLSENAENISTEIIERFLDKWDWKILIDNRNINWSFELFEKYKRYIPVSDFDHLKRSALWSDLVDIDAQIIRGKVLSDV
jgi:hypothetical protein